MLGAVAITGESLEMAYGEQKVLDNANLTIHEGERIGLVGRNGCGKSTFMKILAGVEVADAGELTSRRGLRTGYLPQEFTLDDSATVLENIREGSAHTIALLKDYETLPHEDPRWHTAESELLRLDGWNLDARIAAVMDALKCSPSDSIVGNLSGGEKRRVALAKALIAEPDLLILDEPTNHLDTDSIEWLEEFLKSYKGACLFVTHDRYFLDRICTRIIELSQGEFSSYKGNYSDYLTEKSERMERDEVNEAKRQKFLKKELEWVRKGAKARTTKAQFRVNRYNDMASEKGLEREKEAEIIMPPATRLGNRVVDLSDVAVRYGDRTIFEGLDLEIQPGSKIGIIGPNGAGKSTLIKTILGLNKPTEGNVFISDNTEFNYIDQERLVVDENKTVQEEIGEGRDYVMLGEDRISIWGYLKRFLFEDERIRIKVGRLSGGERARLLLAKVLKRGGNFVVLDEPTNDLDLSTLRLLEDALIDFAGCVLVVSHDRYFLNRVCDSIFAFEPDGGLTHHVGGYDYYMEQRGSKFKKNVEKKASKVDSRKKEEPKVRKLKWKEERELEGMEEAIFDIEADVESLESEFMDPDFFKQEPDVVKNKQIALEELQANRDALYARWEELEAIKDGLVEI